LQPCCVVVFLYSIVLSKIMKCEERPFDCQESNADESTLDTFNKSESSQITFSDLGVREPFLKGLTRMKFFAPSPIQAKAIPSKSGTGKTCVFSILAVHMVRKEADSGVQVIIVTPTCEIAIQIQHVINQIAHFDEHLKCQFFSGKFRSLLLDKNELKRCQIVVGTPGRLCHLVKLNAISVERVRMLVFDEADRLMNGTFRPSRTFQPSFCKQASGSDVGYISAGFL
ncbi:putative ATP-dependent RNA helicase DDX20, partial [Trichinella pseudospiralis]